MAPARPGLFDFDDTLPARIVLLDTDLIHPASGVDGFHPCGVEALADIVVPDPQRGRPQAGAETDRSVEALVASLLAVVGHLQIVAVEQGLVGTFEQAITCMFIPSIFIFSPGSVRFTTGRPELSSAWK